MKLPFIIISRRKLEDITSTRDYLQSKLNECRTSNINLAEQVRNLHYNYEHTLDKLHETTRDLRRTINEYNKLKKRIKS